MGANTRKVWQREWKCYTQELRSMIRGRVVDCQQKVCSFWGVQAAVLGAFVWYPWTLNGVPADQGVQGASSRNSGLSNHVSSPPPQQNTVQGVMAEVLDVLQTREYLGAPSWRVPTKEALFKKLASRRTPPTPQSCHEIAPLVRSFLAEVGPSLFFVTPSDPEFGVIENIFDPEQGSSRSWPHLGVKAEIRGRKVFVGDILVGSPADAAGLLSGDEIISIQGRTQMAPLLDSLPLEPRTTWEIQREPTPKSRRKLTLDDPAPESRATLDQLIARHIERSTRIIRVDHKPPVLYIPLAATHRPTFFEALRTSLRTQKIQISPNGPAEGGKLLPTVVDLRGAFGPVGPSALELMEELRLLPSPASTLQTPDERKKLLKLVILIDKTTLGGREWLAWMLKMKAQGTLIGDVTGGMWTSATWIKTTSCPGGLLIPAQISRSPLPEGTGLSPDKVVKKGISYRSGHDPLLQTALDHVWETAN